jgi:release factor glutamine methyltransferase
METLATYQQRAVNALTPSYGARESQNIVRFWLEVRGGFSRMDLVLRGIEEVELVWFDADLERLIALEPVHYVVGCAYFMEQLLEVNATTLVPRPETEELVRGIVDYISDASVRTLVDVGTGSGCIALGIKSLRDAWEVTGIDVQAGAVAVAKRNAGAWGLDVGFKQQDVRTMDRLTEDVIVSNPPYIPRSEGATMDRHVVGEEPDVALFVPDDQPLEFYEMILEKGIKVAPERSRYFGFEIHEDFGPEMVELAHRYGLKNVELVQDLQGKDRMIFGRYDG